VEKVLHASTSTKKEETSMKRRGPHFLPIFINPLFFYFTFFSFFDIFAFLAFLAFFPFMCFSQTKVFSRKK